MGRAGGLLTCPAVASIGRPLSPQWRARGVAFLGRPPRLHFCRAGGSVPATLLSTCARGTSLPPATCFSYPEASQIRGTDVKG